MVSFTFVIRFVFINSTKKTTCSLQQTSLSSSWWNILYTKLKNYLKIQTKVTFRTQQTGTASNDLSGFLAEYGQTTSIGKKWSIGRKSQLENIEILSYIYFGVLHLFAPYSLLSSF